VHNLNPSSFFAAAAYQKKHCDKKKNEKFSKTLTVFFAAWMDALPMSFLDLMAKETVKVIARSRRAGDWLIRMMHGLQSMYKPGQGMPAWLQDESTGESGSGKHKSASTTLSFLPPLFALADPPCRSFLQTSRTRPHCGKVPAPTTGPGSSTKAILR